jgi:hypothetical protein
MLKTSIAQPLLHAGGSVTWKNEPNVTGARQQAVVVLGQWLNLC